MLFFTELNVSMEIIFGLAQFPNSDFSCLKNEIFIVNWNEFWN